MLKRAAAAGPERGRFGSAMASPVSTLRFRRGERTSLVQQRLVDGPRWRQGALDDTAQSCSRLTSHALTP